ncbi:Oidioi.mRNA.OKI2018_I69.XSR.g16541.t1.cds [Oikopleura dioica]|uniref:Oidioi.mRNA.OKI2018_I69.XSR.g16541.t1.cds n=1 Tax=Oikopleura dioica TaxID=34765 RepID=A0ABN7SKC9_OIKDI|nr:Oidioi.mRNA.OKI2018_I69.XSR.g16541.t1.cds [Oikopleura dioica]
MKIGALLFGAALAQGKKSERELNDDVRDHFRTEEEANEFLKWRREKYQRERHEERRDQKYEIIEDQREFERSRGGNDRRSREYQKEREEEQYDRLEEEREYRREEKRRRNRDL